MKTKVLLLSLPVLLLYGCLEQGDLNTSPELSFDKEEVFAVADVMTGDGELTKTIRISSNRSWSAHLNDLDNPIDETDISQSVPWASISVEEHSNVTGVTDEVEVTISFNRNYSKQQINGVLNIYSEGQLRKSIPLTQAGVVYSIDASLEEDGAVSDNGGTVFVKVKSNAPWTVKLDPSSTADAVLLTNEGVDSGQIRLRLRANDDPSEKTAKVVISADGLEDKIVEIKQQPVDPNVKFFTFETSFVATGTRLLQVPAIIIDKSKLDPDLVNAGVKFYYKMGTEGFSDDLIPDNTCPEVPDSGIPFATEVVKKNEAYIQILAEAPGYRPVNMKVDCRHWRLGSAYYSAIGTTDELYISRSTTIKAEYLQYESARTEIGTTAKYDGSIRVTRLFYNNTSKTKMSFIIDGNDVGNKTYKDKETTSSKPDMLVSPLVAVKKGARAYVENTNKVKGQIITFACLEQFTYKP